MTSSPLRPQLYVPRIPGVPDDYALEPDKYGLSAEVRGAYRKKHQTLPVVASSQRENQQAMPTKQLLFWCQHSLGDSLHVTLPIGHHNQRQGRGQAARVDAQAAEMGG